MGDTGEEKEQTFPIRKSIDQFDESFTLTEFAAKVISWHYDKGKICAIHLIFQISDNAGDSVSKISICNATPNLLKGLGIFLLQSGEELEKNI